MTIAILLILYGCASAGASDLNTQIDALWAPKPDTHALVWPSARRQINAFFNVLSLPAPHARRLRPRLEAMSRAMPKLNDYEVEAAVGSHAALFARTVERVLEAPNSATADARLVDVVKVLASAHVLIGHGRGGTWRRALASVPGLDPAPRLKVEFWKTVFRRLNSTPFGAAIFDPEMEVTNPNPIRRAVIASLARRPLFPFVLACDEALAD